MQLDVQPELELVSEQQYGRSTLLGFHLLAPASSRLPAAVATVATAFASDSSAAAVTTADMAGTAGSEEVAAATEITSASCARATEAALDLPAAAPNLSPSFTCARSDRWPVATAAGTEFPSREAAARLLVYTFLPLPVPRLPLLLSWWLPPWLVRRRPWSLLLLLFLLLLLLLLR